MTAVHRGIKVQCIQTTEHSGEVKEVEITCTKGQVYRVAVKNNILLKIIYNINITYIMETISECKM